MPISIPTRETAAATVGPRLDVSPSVLRQHLQQSHGLSALIAASKSWEPFAWKGQDYSAPMRALFVAEGRGLLAKRNERATDVYINDVLTDINEWLRAFGKREIALSTTIAALRKAAAYVNVATGCSIVVDTKTMTIRFVDQYESAENVERYYTEVKAKLTKLGKELDHAEQNNYDVSKILTACSNDTGVTLQLAGSAA